MSILAIYKGRGEGLDGPFILTVPCGDQSDIMLLRASTRIKMLMHSISPHVGDELVLDSEPVVLGGRTCHQMTIRRPK